MNSSEYDVVLNDRLIRFNQLASVANEVARSHALTPREKLVCSNSLLAELAYLKCVIAKICNGEDHQNEKQGPAKRK